MSFISVKARCRQKSVSLCCEAGVSDNNYKFCQVSLYLEIYVSSPNFKFSTGLAVVGTIVKRGDCVMYLEKQKPSLLVSVFQDNETGDYHY